MKNLVTVLAVTVPTISTLLTIIWYWHRRKKARSEQRNVTVTEQTSGCADDQAQEQSSRRAASNNTSHAACSNKANVVETNMSNNSGNVAQAAEQMRVKCRGDNSGTVIAPVTDSSSRGVDASNRATNNTTGLSQDSSVFLMSSNVCDRGTDSSSVDSKQTDAPSSQTLGVHYAPSLIETDEKLFESESHCGQSTDVEDLKTGDAVEESATKQMDIDDSDMTGRLNSAGGDSSPVDVIPATVATGNGNSVDHTSWYNIVSEMDECGDGEEEGDSAAEFVEDADETRGNENTSSQIKVKKIQSYLNAALDSMNQVTNVEHVDDARANCDSAPASEPYSNVQQHSNIPPDSNVQQHSTVQQQSVLQCDAGYTEGVNANAAPLVVTEEVRPVTEVVLLSMNPLEVNTNIDPDLNVTASPSVSSSDNGSEMSGDSGRGASICNNINLQAPRGVSVYEIDIPVDICGKFIGKRGTNINVLKQKSNCNISIKDHPYSLDLQLCTLEGTPGDIQNAIKLIQERFPRLDITPSSAGNILEQPMPPELMQLQLPVNVSVDAIISSIVDAGHVFIQQPSQPSYQSLDQLINCMALCYNNDLTVPGLPRPLTPGVICTVPLMNLWYRAEIIHVLEETNECDIKFLDFGGFTRINCDCPRQIRSDFMNLSFQAVQCYLANISPLQDEPAFSALASQYLEKLSQGKLLQAQVVGQSAEGIPLIHLYLINGTSAILLNKELANQGVVSWIEL